MRQATDMFLLFALIVFLGATSSCSSRSTLSSRRPGTSGLWEYFLSRSPKVSADLLQKGRAFDMVNTAESLSLHGDAHVLALTPKGTDFALRAPVAGRTGPWWLDLAFAETSTQVLALSNGLRLFRGGACVDAYAKALNARLRNVALPAQKWPLLPDGVVLESSATAFTNAALAPLEGESFPNLEQANARCADAERASVFYGAVALPDACVISTNDEGVIQALHKVRGEANSGPGAPKPEAFANEETLDHHARAFCAQLAAAHARAWDDARLQRVVLVIEKNRNLKRRLARFAEEEAARLQTEWRAALRN